MDADTKAMLDIAVSALRRKAQQFAVISAGSRARILRATIPHIVDSAEEWVREACRAKRVPFSSPVAGEEWFAGPVVTVRNVRLLAETLESIERGGAPPFGKGVRERRDGVLDVEVFPVSRTDAASASGFRCAVRFPSGTQVPAARDAAGAYYRLSRQQRPRGVCVVLGAGNVSSIPAMDVLAKTFIEGHVCVLKMNPVNAWLGPVLGRALRPLIELGYLRIVYGGAEEGEHLCRHDGITAVHVTGSAATHDAVVWGGDPGERARRKREGRPVLAKPVTSELGNVSPVIIAPAEYDARELLAMAWNVASMKANNASCNCNAAQVLVTSSGWRQREQFLGLLRSAFERIPTRQPYYPGAAERYASLCDGRGERLGAAAGGALPWALVPDLDPENGDEPLFRDEAFCPALGETALPSSDPGEFLDRAAAFCNRRLYGTLNACVFVPPGLDADADLGAALDKAVDGLRYGTVAVNHWPGLGYGLVSPPWGAAPGGTLADPGSGIGWVHNTFMLDGMEKVILQGPLVPHPKPPWFANNAAAHDLGRRLVAFEASPSWLKLPGLAAAALKG